MKLCHLVSQVKLIYVVVMVSGPVPWRHWTCLLQSKKKDFCCHVEILCQVLNGKTAWKSQELIENPSPERKKKKSQINNSCPLLNSLDNEWQFSYRWGLQEKIIPTNYWCFSYGGLLTHLDLSFTYSSPSALLWIASSTFCLPTADCPPLNCVKIFALPQVHSFGFCIGSDKRWV